jgi:hypothetical protein
MRTRTIVVSGVLVLLAGAGAASSRLLAADSLASEEKPKVASGVPDLSGSWVLDKDLSDDAHQKMRDAAERPRGGYGRPGMGGPGMGGPGVGMPPTVISGDDDAGDSMHAIFDPAEELSVYQGQPEIVMDEKFVRRRTLHADGKKYKAENGMSEVKTQWKEGRLIVETRGFRGRKTTETWELNATGKRLTALIKVASGFGPAVTIKRVYDRVGAPPSPAPPASGAPPLPPDQP